METPKVDLDYILVNEIGQFGLYQIRTIAVILLPIIVTAFSQDFIFTAAGLNTRCRIDGCDETNPEYAPEWILNAVPGSSLSNFDNCNRFANSSLALESVNGTCPAEGFDQTLIVACDSYVYENTNSIVYDFNLECDEWLRVLIGTLGSLGSLVVLSYTGIVSDRFGRKRTMLFNAYNFVIVGIIKSFSVNYIMYASLHFLQSAIGFGAMTAGYVLVTELVGPKWRVQAGISCNMAFGVGQTILGFMAWWLTEWRTLLLALYIPQLILYIPCFLFVNESVRWLISKKNYSRAEDILRTAAEVNGSFVEDESMKSMFQTTTGEVKEKFNLREIFESPAMIKRICTVPIWWVTATLVYYGISINSTSLSGNMYLNYILVSVVELPGYASSYFFISKFGRKWSLFCLYLFCGLCQITFIFVPENQSAVRLILFMCGKLSISCVFAAIYVYTSELFPTKFRHSLLGFSSAVGRIGSVAAPLTPGLMIYWQGFPSLIFGVMAFISAGLTLTTPETLNIKLPDTVKEASAIGSEKGHFS